MPLLIVLLLAQAVLPNNQLQIVEERTSQSLLNTPESTLSIEIKALLPDGSHEVLMCNDFRDNWCKTVQVLKPKKLDRKDRHCSDSATVDRNQPGFNSASHACTYSHMGTFVFERKGNSVTIFGRDGKSVLQIKGNWL